jgi:hypothetical protein
MRCLIFGHHWSFLHYNVFGKPVVICSRCAKQKVAR